MFEESVKSFETHRRLSKTIENFDSSNRNNAKESNKHANSSVRICRGFLEILGLLRMNDDKKFSMRFVVSNFLPIVCYFGLGIRTIPTILYTIIDAKDIKQICVLIARLLFCLMSWSKYVCLQFHRRDIEKCIEDIEMDWSLVDDNVSRDIMIEYSRYGLLVTKICAVFTYTGATWQATLPHVLKKSANAIVETDNVTETASVRLFTVPSHFGFSAVTTTPIYEIVYTSQIVATYMMHSIAVASYSVAVVTVMHACGQLKILMEKIRNLIDDENREIDNDSVDKRLSDIIGHHVKILRFISRAENMLRGICLTELGGCTLEMCFVGYFGIVELRQEHTNYVALITWSTLVITFTFNIFSFCFIAELLTQECARVGEITYTIPWYRLPGKQPLALCLIMTMAHSPVTLTAGGAIPLSFRCFASVVKTSVGYLNMLRTVMD